MKLDVDFYNEDSEVYNDVKQYMEIIRELIDLMVTTKYSFCCGISSQFLHMPSEIHW